MAKIKIGIGTYRIGENRTEQKADICFTARWCKEASQAIARKYLGTQEFASTPIYIESKDLTDCNSTK